MLNPVIYPKGITKISPDGIKWYGLNSPFKHRIMYGSRPDGTYIRFKRSWPADRMHGFSVVTEAHIKHVAKTKWYERMRA